MSLDKQNKLWGGRFTESTDAFVQAFTASVDFDQRLAPYDIQGSVAHAKMLTKVGILTEQECQQIEEGLADILSCIQAGEFEWSVALEDVHMNIEAALTERIGMAGKKLHTGRSRNDQVATDIRLFLRDQLGMIQSELKRLQQGLVSLAEQHTDTIMPGFTHLQVAQPVTFGHHLMAWFEMLKRDAERFADCAKRVNVMPLGSAALAGTSYPIDRFMTAELLGFSRPSANSLDGVSDRDFAIEFCAASALLMTHLSRFSEEIVLWTSAQFNFVDLPDAFSMLKAAKQGFSTATDLADYLVGKGIAFRDAHEIVGLAVRLGTETGRDLSELSLDELQGFSQDIGDDVFQVLTLEGSVCARNHLGGTAPNQVRQAIMDAKTLLAE